ncbi:MAG: acyl-CoA thioester hydrolase/BAAT C-terminal domain-containing protein [Actinomycetota bacterium]
MALEFGGDPGVNARASAESWARVLSFLEESLG